MMTEAEIQKMIARHIEQAEKAVNGSVYQYHVGAVTALKAVLGEAAC
jgi:hypothetical protein